MFIVLFKAFNGKIKTGETMYILQSRYKLENSYLHYYGIRNKENLFKNFIKLNKKQVNIIKQLPKDLSVEEKRILGSKILDIAVVTIDKYKKIPTSLDEAHFCKTCAANDFIIPGIEFDENGLCPLCQTKDETKYMKAVVPVLNDIPHSKKSRFDVAVFYTGGKDSTFLLYYLSKVKNLRVLALTWEIPYMSLSAKLSIEGAKKHLDKVEFVSRKIDNESLKKIYSKLYELNGNTCACPSLAYVLFYEFLVDEKIPYFVCGNEPAQMKGLYYNNMAPKIAYKFADSKLLNFLISLGRILTLHPPFKRGQFQTLVTMKQLAYGDNILKKLSGYKNELVSNVCKAIKEVPSILKPLKRAIRRSSWRGSIPSFIQVDLNDISKDGIYDWRKIKDILKNECGYVAPESLSKGLHTSCQIEKCKEHSQFIRFYNMESSMIPFSALEISLASRDNNISKEEAIKEIKENLGFSLEEVEECQIMKQYFQK